MNISYAIITNCKNDVLIISVSHFNEFALLYFKNLSVDPTKL